MSTPLKPASQRRNRVKPVGGEWKPTPGIGWQHGEIPEPPDGLLAASREAWNVWMRAWFASHWTTADLPGLRVVIRQFDSIQRGQAKANDVTAIVRLMDNYGITPAGQQARRWAPPSDGPAPSVTKTDEGPYAGLRVVNG